MSSEVTAQPHVPPLVLCAVTRRVVHIALQKQCTRRQQRARSKAVPTVSPLTPFPLPHTPRCVVHWKCVDMEGVVGRCSQGHGGSTFVIVPTARHRTACQRHGCYGTGWPPGHSRDIVFSVLQLPR